MKPDVNRPSLVSLPPLQQPAIVINMEGEGAKNRCFLQTYCAERPCDLSLHRGKI